MNRRLTALALLSATALAIAPLSPAQARGWDHGGGWGHHGGWGGHGGYGGHHHGDGLLYGLVGLGVGLTVAAATIATAPVRVAADAIDSRPYYNEPDEYPGARPTRERVAYNDYEGGPDYAPQGYAPQGYAPPAYAQPRYAYNGYGGYPGGAYPAPYYGNPYRGGYAYAPPYAYGY